MPLASHLRCVALALGISTALGCANRNQPAPRAESLDPGLSRVAGTRGDALPAQWWTLYQDPGLNHLVAALRHNRDLAAADAHARAPRPSARRTGRTLATDRGRLWLPVWARRRRPDLAEATDEDVRSQWKHTARLDLSYQLDLWGEVRARIAAAKADAEAAQAARDLLRVSVASQTTLAYVRACALARRAEVQRRSVGLLDASLELSERQLAAGLPASCSDAGCWPCASGPAPRCRCSRRGGARHSTNWRCSAGARRASWTLPPRPAPAYRNCAVPCPPATAGACWRAARTSARPSAGSPPPTPGARWPKPSCTRASASPSAPKPPQ